MLVWRGQLEHVSQWPAVAAGLVQIAGSSAGVVGDRDEPGRGGEVTGAGKCGQVTGGDEQCGTENGTESGHGLDDGGLGVFIEQRGDLGVEVGEAQLVVAERPPAGQGPGCWRRARR